MTAPNSVYGACCAVCGESLPERSEGRGGRPRVTCSPRCRDSLYRRRKGMIERGSVVPEHGTLARYRGGSTRPACRCEACREASRNYRYRYPVSALLAARHKADSGAEQ